MTTEQVWWGAVCAATTALALAALVLALRARRRADRAEALAASLADRVGVLESTTPGAIAASATDAPQPVADADSRTYVITHLDEPGEPAPVARPIDGRLFADIVAREAVVKAASWTHGLRRALSAENRNRIRFEVRREARRAGRDRRAEAKQALREFRARERAGDPVRDVREDVA